MKAKVRESLTSNESYSHAALPINEFEDDIEIPNLSRGVSTNSAYFGSVLMVTPNID